MDYNVINIEGLTYGELVTKKQELMDELDLRLDVIKDQANRMIEGLMPNGWVVRYVSDRCIGLYCKGIASNLDLMVEDLTDNPNDFTMNVVGCGSFSVTEEGWVRNYYLGVASIITNVELRGVILSTFSKIYDAFFHEEEGVMVDISRSIYFIGRKMHEIMREEGLV